LPPPPLCPIADTRAGEPEALYPFLGCSQLAETADRFDMMRAVFHGHAPIAAPAPAQRDVASRIQFAAPVEKPTGNCYTLVEI